MTMTHAQTAVPVDFINADQLGRFAAAPRIDSTSLPMPAAPGLREMAAALAAGPVVADRSAAPIRRERGATVIDRGVTTFIAELSDENWFHDDGTRHFQAYDGETPVEIILDAAIAPRFADAVLPAWTRAWLAACAEILVPRSAVRIPLQLTGPTRTSIWIDSTGALHSVERIVLQDFALLARTAPVAVLESEF